MFLMGVQKTKRKGSESPLCRLFAMSAALDFRKSKRLLLSSLADILASRGSRRKRRDAPHRAKSLFRSIEKQGFVLAFCKAIRVKYFYALQKSSGSR
jgi:hypothetical protein